MSRIKYLFLVLISISTLVNFSQEQIFDNGKGLTNELEVIEKLLHHKIDSLRAKKKIENLTENSALKKAAAAHASWINETGKFSHVQTKAKTKTPQKRVALEGGDATFIGENIAYTLYETELTNKKGKSYRNQTYEAIANDLVQMWKESKGHYQNIMTKEFLTTGIAVAVNLKEQKIYAVQVFGGKQ